MVIRYLGDMLDYEFGDRGKVRFENKCFEFII